MIEPEKGLENEFDGVRMALGHDNRVREAVAAADWSEWVEARKINPESHG